MTPALVTTIKACFAVEGKKSYLRVCAIFVAVSKELGRQPADCENCSQHLHTLIEKLRASYDPMKGDPKTFTYTFARKKGLSFLEKPCERPLGTESKKRKHRRTDGLTQVDVKPFKQPAAHSPSHEPVDHKLPVEPLLRREAVDLLYDSLALLEPSKRHPVTLHYLRGMPWEEIAIELKIPLGTVKSRGIAGYSELTEIIRNDGKRPPKPPRTRKPRPRKD